MLALGADAAIAPGPAAGTACLPGADAAGKGLPVAGSAAAFGVASGAAVSVACGSLFVLQPVIVKANVPVIQNATVMYRKLPLVFINTSPSFYNRNIYVATVWPKLQTYCKREASGSLRDRGGLRQFSDCSVTIAEPPAERAVPP